MVAQNRLQIQLKKDMLPILLLMFSIREVQTLETSLYVCGNTLNTMGVLNYEVLYCQHQQEQMEHILVFL